MKFSNFEKIVFGGIFIGWIQLMFGYWHHAFFSLGIIIVVTLLAIFEFRRTS